MVTKLEIQVLNARCYIHNKPGLQWQNLTKFSGWRSAIARKLYLPLFLEIKLTIIWRELHKVFIQTSTHTELKGHFKVKFYRLHAFVSDAALVRPYPTM